ncbi:MAG: tyrosine-type recombinase/integrase [Beijerinckiaceae bacterium]
MAALRYLTKRAGFWYFVRRIPDQLAALDRRVIVRTSTGIRIADDPKAVRAKSAAHRLNIDLEAYWQTILTGPTNQALARYEAARQQARESGFRYRDAAALAKESSVDELLARIETLIQKNQIEDVGAVDALLGGIAAPDIMLSDLYAEYEKDMLASLTDLSPQQRQKWGNPKKRAVANLISVAGDKPIQKLTRNDALDFREVWQRRIITEGRDIGTANKDIGHLNRMFRIVSQNRRLGLASPFAEMRIEGERGGQRTAFETDFLAHRLLAPDALCGLNPEARAIFYIIVETGMRLSEACNLTGNTIILNHDVPHVCVEPEGRRMKTDQSRRQIPLVGVSLIAAQAFPQGFPRYRDKASSLSALVNDYLDLHGLRPTPKHSFYSLRHSFEDRLTAVEPPDKIIAMLMGHKYQRPRYGAGPSLVQKQQWLAKIALEPPPAI